MSRHCPVVEHPIDAIPSISTGFVGEATQECPILNDIETSVDADAIEISMVCIHSPVGLHLTVPMPFPPNGRQVFPASSEML